MKTTILTLLVLGATLVQAEDKLYDEALAKKAVMVVRVELQRARPEPFPEKYPYICYTVHPLQVFKNEYYQINPGHFDVLGFKGKGGVPSGESTIYVERYDVASKQFGGKEGTVWMLLGGGGTNGVSHIGSKSSSQ